MILTKILTGYLIGAIVFMALITVSTGYYSEYQITNNDPNDYGDKIFSSFNSTSSLMSDRSNTWRDTFSSNSTQSSTQNTAIKFFGISVDILSSMLNFFGSMFEVFYIIAAALQIPSWLASFAIAIFLITFVMAIILLITRWGAV